MDLDEITRKQKIKSFPLPENSLEQIKSLIELSDDLVFYLDTNGIIKSINKNGALLLDLNLTELKGKYFIQFFKMPIRPTVIKALKEVINEDKIVVFESGITGKNNIEYSFKFRLKAVLENNEVKGVIGIGKNISFIKKLEEKISELSEKFKEANRIINIERSRGVQKISLLEELNRMKAEFVSNISHEFRTPLASIIGFSESIQSDISMAQEHQREFNEIILSEGKRLAKLISDVLDLTRLEKGEINLTKTSFNFISLLESVIEKNLEVMRKKELIFTKEVPEEDINIKGDKESIAQVLNDLLNNSIKFTGRGGRISVFVHSFFKEFEVIITDTGIGIPKKNLPYIFKKYLSDSKSTEQALQEGLGLVFVKHIVDLHKGSITIQSEVNEGTTVIVKLLKEE